MKNMRFYNHNIPSHSNMYFPKHLNHYVKNALRCIYILEEYANNVLNCPRLTEEINILHEKWTYILEKWKKYIVVLKKEILSKPTERSNAGITRKELHNVFSQANKIEYKRVLQKFSLLIKDNKAKIKKDRISHNMKTLQEEKIVHEKYNARV